MHIFWGVHTNVRVFTWMGGGGAGWLAKGWLAGYQVPGTRQIEYNEELHYDMYILLTIVD